MRIEWALWSASMAVALLALAGCGKSSSMITVSGAVTVDGTPVEKGAILFVPAKGDAPTTGGEIRAGRYSVKVPRGVMKVSISAPKVVGKKKLYPTPNSPEMEVTEESLPAKYNERTELQFEVSSAANQHDFNLQKQ